ncbi:MAG: hypothetical protein KGJ07_06795 [Patescibacteria group bacterium]|nr:hypothetical protein [Patescibacteria group bacterium]MDE2588339.1 hypothetical protein [Patescibacteria group bacterium]
MKKPKYFKGAKRKQKAVKEPVVESPAQKHIASKAEFPKNSRPIPETSHKHAFIRPHVFVHLKRVKGVHLWLQGWNIAAIVLLLLICAAMNKSLQVLKEKNIQRQVLISQLHRWEEISSTYSGYRDAYVQQALLAYKLGEKNLALSFIQKALTLDPNDDSAVHLEELIAKMGE